MGLYLTVAIIIEIISTLFLILSLYGTIEKYSSRTIILSIFFLILTLKYLFIIYYLYSNIIIPDFIQYIPDLLIIIVLIAFMVSR